MAGSERLGQWSQYGNPANWRMPGNCGPWGAFRASHFRGPTGFWKL